MGLDISAVEYLLRARKQGVEFGDVLMVGRLKLDVFPAKVSQLLRQNGLPDDPFREGRKPSGFGEEFFQCLGARSVTALDASSYEGAGLVHDMNLPVPEGLKERYDVVYDGGTLEHVFNIPTALKNCMEMVRVGGHLFIDSPGNNWFGHGFYQFSPEFFYRGLSPANGFEVVEMIAHAAGPNAKWYKVADPDQINSRVELISFTLIHLITRAKKTGKAEIFKAMPQQSDYTVAWESDKGDKPITANEGLFCRATRKTFPAVAHLFKAVKTALFLYHSHSLRNRRYFTPVKRN